MVEYPITLWVTFHTSPFNTKLVVALGNQGVLCWVYVFMNPMREGIEFRVNVRLGAFHKLRLHFFEFFDHVRP